MKRRDLMFGMTLSFFAPGAMASAPDTEAVEYYNIFNKHYFITASGADVRIVDAGGAGPGWMRTGRSFQAWMAKSGAPGDAYPVCRFYSSKANSHFYTASAGECEGLKNAKGEWRFEGIAFYIQAPVNGQCPAGTVNVMRLYNNGFANGEGANHRFVDDESLHQLMADSRWIREGVAFCAQAKSSGTSANLPPTTTGFSVLAGTWTGPAKWEVEREDDDDHDDDEDDEHKVTKPLRLALTAAGAITGSGYGCTFTGQVRIGDGFRSFFQGTVTASGCTDPAFNGEYMHLKLQRFGSDTLMVKMKRGHDDDDEVSITAVLSLDGATAPPPPVTPVTGLAGEWIGTVRWEAETHDLEIAANRALTLRISPSGAVSGSGFGCTFAGTIGGEVRATGCEQAIFNGAYRLHAKQKHGRLEISLERESGGIEVEIEGTLHAKDGSLPEPPAPAKTLPGTWEGRISWSVGSASGSDSIRFTIGADGAFSGRALGCTLTGTLRLSDDGRNVRSGSIRASGCARPELNGTFDEVEFEREDGDALEFEFERESGGVEVELKGVVRKVS